MKEKSYVLVKISSKNWCWYGIIFIFQCIASGLLGVNGLLVLSPVDMELDIEVGERSKLLNMVVEDVMEVIEQNSHVL